MPTVTNLEQRQHLRDFIQNQLLSNPDYPHSSAKLAVNIWPKLKGCAHLEVRFLDTTVELLETILKQAPNDPISKEDLFEACSAYNYDLLEAARKYLFYPDLEMLITVGLVRVQGDFVHLNMTAEPTSIHMIQSSIGLPQNTRFKQRKRKHTDEIATETEKKEEVGDIKMIDEIPSTSFHLNKLASASKFAELLQYCNLKKIPEDVLSEIIQKSISHYKMHKPRGKNIENYFLLLPSENEPKLFCRVVSHADPSRNLNKMKATLERLKLENEGDFRIVYLNGQKADKFYFVWFAQSDTATLTLNEFMKNWKTHFPMKMIFFSNKKAKIVEPAAAAANSSELINRDNNHRP